MAMRWDEGKRSSITQARSPKPSLTMDSFWDEPPFGPMNFFNKFSKTVEGPIKDDSTTHV